MGCQLVVRNNHAVITVAGRFEFANHGDFRQCVKEVLHTEGIRTVEVVLAGVEYLDIAALGMLLVLMEKAEKAGMGKVTLSGVKGMVQHVFAIANFDRMFTIH